MSKRADIRPATDEDIPFITATWLRYFKEYSYFAKRIRDHIFFKYHHKILERILNHPTTQTEMAVDPADHQTIWGYISYNKASEDLPPIIHFIYVKGSFRKFGIGSQLLEHARLDLDKTHFTHWTYDTDELIKKFNQLTYNPYLT